MNKRTTLTGKIDYKTFIETYNTVGKLAAVKYVTETYGVRYDSVVKRLKNESEYIYNRRKDKYVLKSEADSPFLSMEELCGDSEIQTGAIIDTNEIITNLIKDKFFEISKYVTLEQSSKKIFLSLSKVKSAGYEIQYL